MSETDKSKGKYKYPKLYQEGFDWEKTMTQRVRIFIFCTILLVLSIDAIYASDILKISAPPSIWVQKQGDRLTGPIIDLLETIFSDYNIKIESVTLPWARAIARMKSGKLDLIPVIYSPINTVEAVSQKVVRLTTGEWPPYTSERLEDYGIFSKKITHSKQLAEALGRGIAKPKLNRRYQETISECFSKEQILVALAHWPPWKIIRAGEFNGIDVAILDEIGKQIDIKFQFIECPWKRCVEMIRTGKVDMITSFSRTPDRETFVEYLEPAYRTEKVVFYKKKGNSIEVKQYEDLYKYRIGTVNASKYFDPFNNDSRLNKLKVANDYQLPHMLASGRIDLLAGHDKSMDYFINLEGFKGKFEKLPFSVSGISAYLAISKRSAAINSRKKFEKALRKMVETGRIDSVIDAYLSNIKPTDKQ